MRLHNGTIWRWNRPLIGFDYDGLPHLRIEQRVLPAGPTIVDMIANAAFFHGLVQSLVTQDDAPEAQLAFSAARDNFYAAAKRGLDAHVHWMGEERGVLRTLVMERLLPMARSGLEQLEIDRADIDRYLWVIEARVLSGQTGADWQREAAALCGNDLAVMMAAYRERQESGQPVHELC